MIVPHWSCSRLLRSASLRVSSPRLRWMPGLRKCVMTLNAKPLHQPNYVQWLRPQQGRVVNWLQEYRNSDEYRNQINKYKSGLLNVPKLGEVAAMISEMNSKVKPGKGRPLINGRPLPNPEDPKWVHADVLNSLHEIVGIFPGTARTRNNLKQQLYQLIENYYGSPYQAPSASHWYRQATFAVEMAVASVHENRTIDNDRCVVPGLTQAINDAIETCVAERAGLTLEEYRNQPKSGETDMTIQDNSKAAATLTPVSQAVTDVITSAADTSTTTTAATTAASDVEQFQHLVESFPSNPSTAMPAGVHAVTPKLVRAAFIEDGREVPVDLSNIKPKETTEMNTPESIEQVTAKIQSAASQIPETAREVQEAAESIASQAARSAQQTLNNAGDKLHAAATSLSAAIKKPTFWQKARKVAAWTAAGAAVGGAAYVAYRYFKDGQGPVETVSGAIEAAKEVVANSTDA